LRRYSVGQWPVWRCWAEYSQRKHETNRAVASLRPAPAGEQSRR
jgi:hypothetical protein